MADHYNVLFLCTGNSARSIMAEAILNHKGRGKFTAYSAGSHPTGQPRPEALQQIESAGLSTAGLRSKSWDEFSGPTAPKLDFVLTVCDNAAKEQCPYWPGQPMTAHWGMADPAAVKGAPDEIAHAFRDAFTVLDRRIGLFLLSVPEHPLHFGPRTSITSPLCSKGFGFGLSWSCILKYAISRGCGNVVIPQGFPKSVGRASHNQNPQKAF